MTSKKLDRQELIDEVKARIEANFVDSVVIRVGTGWPDDEHDDTEIFEALWIPDTEYKRFEDFVWDLQENLAEINGFTIMVHGLSPKVTKEHRWEEYQSERKKRISKPA